MSKPAKKPITSRSRVSRLRQARTVASAPIDNEKQRTLRAFTQLSEEVAELNKTCPLPPSFDETLRRPFKLSELAAL